MSALTGEVKQESSPNYDVIILEDDDDTVYPGQFPCNAEEKFECALIDEVEKQPCIYNRNHSLHKMGEYKMHLWIVIAEKVGYKGPGEELERRWRHMRDRYVRLRKQIKTTQPLKKNDKWYHYYKRMCFLDPYIEHRNRRKPENYNFTNFWKVATNAQDSVLDTSMERQHEEGSDSGEGEPDMGPLKGFCETFVAQALNATAPREQPVMEQPSPVLTSAPSPSCSSALSSPPPAKKMRTETSEDNNHETNVSLFARSIEMTLKSMDPESFALARVEIWRVVYSCQFGKKNK